MSVERMDTKTTAGKSDNACRFCAIIRGENPAYLVHEEASSIAFLDRRPLFPGHTLLVPREHVTTLAELPECLVAPLFSIARLLARAVEEGMGAEGSFVALNNRVSQSIPHLHVHIVPRRKHDGLKGFFWPRHPYESEAAAVEAQQAIRAVVEHLLHAQTQART